MLLDHGANVNIANKTGVAVLQIVTKKCKNHSICLNSKLGYKSQELLLLFNYLGQSAIADMLIKLGANVDMRDSDGLTALHWASIKSISNALLNHLILLSMNI